MTDVGHASKELFVQFLARIAKELPSATLAMFSTLKYVNAPNFEKFRHSWNADYQGGFIVHSKAFDGLNGDFPIGFLILKTNQDAKKKDTYHGNFSRGSSGQKARQVGEKKFYNLPNSTYLNVWMYNQNKRRTGFAAFKRHQRGSENPATQEVLRRDGGLPLRKQQRFATRWNGNLSHVFYFYRRKRRWCIHHSGKPMASGSSFYCAKDRQIHLSNNRDQFLQPTAELTEEFKTDCLLWMLFNGSNLYRERRRSMEWNGKYMELCSTISHPVHRIRSECA